METLILGIDVGGTNTDFAIVDGRKTLLASFKISTSPVIEEGITTGLNQLKVHYPHYWPAIRYVNIGTTQAANAILQGLRLTNVGLIRLCGSRSPRPQPASNWPIAIRQAVLNSYCAIGGGYECDGRPMSLFSLSEVEESIHSLLNKGAQGLAVVGSFSPLYPNQEYEVGRCITKLAGAQFPFTLSHEVGGLGLLERENAAILNTALIPLLTESFKKLEALVQTSGLTAEVWMTQNDGTILSLEDASRFPLKTVASGPNNSFVGGSRLALESDVVIVDIGGTSTDIGIMEKGVVRRSLHAATLGGIALNFSMPDLCSLALGGGTLVNHGIVDKESCGYRLAECAQIFGGTDQTLTDLACLLGYMTIPQAQVQRVTIQPAEAKAILCSQADRVIYEIEKLARRHKEHSVILVGGGAKILEDVLRERLKNSFVQSPPFAAIANAYGAALAEIGATTIRIVELTNRENALSRMREEAIEGAIRQGACPKATRITRIDVVPIPYSANHLTKLVVGAAGARS